MTSDRISRWRCGGRFLRFWVREELALLLAMLTVVGGGWVFVRIADAVAEGEREWIDRTLMGLLREHAARPDPLGPAWLEQAAVALTSLGSYAVVGMWTVIVLGFLLLARRVERALWLLGAVTGGMLLVQGFKHLVERARPELGYDLVEVSTSSFPSGHTTLSAVIYLTLGAMLAPVMERRRLKLYVIMVALVLTAVVGLTRVYLGVHWPTDVLAGWAIGLAWAALVWIGGEMLRRWRNKSLRFPSEPPEPQE